ncbi:hypothetical protein F5I97DRAFT_1840647 [Phlebopus sp. FC_14]|nr:hypothetical protein F5I97DRAFT_1840647 [Phlebopus sp. FC_14]
MNTARLKRKLGDLGVDTSSRRANENFCLIGTPLPPLEKSKDTGEFVPLWKQEVRDEKGRRRLHGAFTGGFSAGYFNTVGSKEGWAPSTFVSSRSDRAKARAARPEDFMDEEDLAERRADQKLVDEHEEMDLTEGMQAERNRQGADEVEKDPITLALEQATLPAPKDSVGARILKKMGWRIGQGIGPRVTWKQHEIQCGRNPDASSAEVDEEARKHTYAPRDTPLILAERKDDFHGLGYTKSLGLHASLGVVPEVAGVSQGPRISAGFGLGALNDADEDDLDVYDHSITHGKRRTAFDDADMHNEEHVVIGGQRQGRGPAAQATPSQIRSTAGRNTFLDGTPLLSGFTLSEKPVAEDMWFPLPEMPKGWKPNPKRVWEEQRGTSSDKENRAARLPPKVQPHALWKAGITADQRGAALGETPLPSAPRSVFEYMSKKDQERIKNIAAGQPVAPSIPIAAVEPPVPSAPTQSYIPHTEPHIAQAALLGFQPFTADAKKQARYTAYLRSHADPGSGVSIPSRMHSQTAEEYAREMSEYAKAAALFRPVSGAMAGRFTSAAVLDLGPKIIEGLHTPTTDQTPKERSPEPEGDNKVGEAKEEDPKVHAARLGMYGPMTRDVKPWQPARLLCKRFGVKDPNPDVHVETATSDASSSMAVPEGTDATRDVSTPSVGIGSGQSSAEARTGSRGKRDLANIGLGDDDGQGDDILTYERPPMDIFKAIFASDDEESDDENGDQGQEDDATRPPTPAPPPDQPAVPEQKGDGTPAELDLSTFKPTFIPRDSQSKRAKGKESGAKEKKSKKSKRAKGGGLVSFDLDEGGGESLSLPAPQSKARDRDPNRPKKKRKKHREDEEEMWVEKPQPDIVKNLPAHVPPDDASEMDIVEAGPPQGRKRAIDFM